MPLPLAVHVQRPPVQVHYALGDEQPEAAPAARLKHLRIELCRDGDERDEVVVEEEMEEEAWMGANDAIDMA